MEHFVNTFEEGIWYKLSDHLPPEFEYNPNVSIEVLTAAYEIDTGKWYYAVTSYWYTQKCFYYVNAHCSVKYWMILSAPTQF